MMRANLESAFSTYLVANTPRYLYTTLRANTDVQEVARTSSVASLVSAFEKYMSAEPSPQTVALAYVTLVALSLKGTDEARLALAGLDVSRLDWGERIRQIASSAAAVEVQMIEAMPAMPLSRRATVTSGAPSAATAVIQFSLTPTR